MAERPEMLLNILPRIEQPLAMLGVTSLLIVPRLKTPTLEGALCLVFCVVILLSGPIGSFI